MKKFLFCYIIWFVSIPLSAQQPLDPWERVIDNHQYGGWVGMYSMGESLLVAASNDNDSTNVPEPYLDRTGSLTKLDREGEIVARTFIYHNDLPAYRSNDLNIRDSIIVVGNTIEKNDTLFPNVMQFDFGLNQISSITSNHYVIRPDISIRAIFRPSGVLTNDLYLHLNPSVIITRDSARLFTIKLSLDGNTDSLMVHHVKPLIGAYRSVHHSPKTGTIISKGNGSMTLLDEDYLGTSTAYFSQSNDYESPETPENNDDFYLTGGECTDGAATEIDGVYYQANASVGILDNVLYTATIVEKWSPSRGFLARAAVNLDTLTWQQGSCFDWLAAGLGRNAIASDGKDGIYLVSNVMKEQHTYVAHCDTNLNVRWRRDWPNEQVRFGHSVAVIDGYDGVYIASVQNPDNSFIGQGELILNRIPSDGGEVVGSSSLIANREAVKDVLLYPNPAASGTSVTLEGKRGDYAYAKLYDASGKEILLDVSNDLRIQLPQHIAQGVYACLLFNGKNKLISQQQLVVN